jgi:major vault protein
MDGVTKRERFRVVSYKVPFNTAVQVYDFKQKTSRVVFGPALVKLEPDETFTLNVLSGQTPKVPGVIKTIALQLGPDFTSDIGKISRDNRSYR